MKKNRIVTVLVVAAGLFSSAANLRAQSASYPVPPTTPAALVPDPKTGSTPMAMGGDFAKSQGISLADAQAAFRDSGPILDFKTTNSKDARFGSIWADYQGGYSVHIRLANGEMSNEIAALQSKLSRKVNVHFGGPSNSEFEDKGRRLRALGVGYFPDETSGSFQIWQAVPPDVGAVSKQIAKPQFRDEWAQAGTNVWGYTGSGWENICTTGFVWRSSTTTGFATANHCNNPAVTYWWQGGGESSPGGAPSSSGCDYRLINHYSGAGVTLYNGSSNGIANIAVHAVAGGYYYGQPTFKMGHSSNGATGTNWGFIIGMANTPVEVGDFSCAGQANFYGPVYNNNSAVKDSGGPVYLLYNNLFYLAALHKGRNPNSPASQARGSWVNWMNLPPGSYICTSTTPC
jgi:hypothetical protein